MRHFDLRKMKRRQFLKLLGSIAATPLMGPLSELAYGAGPFTDYRALVCVFLFGGNDAHNMIVPLDARFATYAANRGPLAIPFANLQANSVTDAVQGISRQVCANRLDPTRAFGHRPGHPRPI